ncbi:prepilin peptidase [Nanoarchaeota archaeon]
MPVVELIIYGIAFIVLLLASISDLKTREVPDSLNFGLIGIGIGVNLLFSIIHFDYGYILHSLIGIIVFLILSFLMYYTGQWGGGDSKLLIGLGALFGLQYSMETFMFSFIVSLLLVGAVYGIFWSIMLGVKNYRNLSREIKKIVNSKHFLFSIFIIVIFIIGGVIGATIGHPQLRLFYLLLSIVLFLTFPLYIYIKAVENGCMKKYIEPAKLTEGDWVAKDVIIRGKRVCGPKDLGINKEQIKKLKILKVKKILIKEGIPFVPSFFLAFIVSVIFQDYIVTIVKTFIY